MYEKYFNVMGFSTLPVSLLSLLIVLAIWSLVWKGIALWKAARNADKVWYIVLLVLNTAGILEIIYILFFSKKK